MRLSVPVDRTRCLGTRAAGPPGAGAQRAFEQGRCRRRCRLQLDFRAQAGNAAELGRVGADALVTLYVDTASGSIVTTTCEEPEQRKLRNRFC